MGAGWSASQRDAFGINRRDAKKAELCKDCIVILCENFAPWRLCGEKVATEILSVAGFLFDKVLFEQCIKLIHAHGNTLFKAHLYDLLQLFFCGVDKLKINTGALGGFCERASSF